MTVSNQVVDVTFQGNGSTTGFAVPFRLFDDDQIRVILRDETNPAVIIETLQVLGVDYTLSGGPPSNTVNMTIAPTTTQKLYIVRASTLTQIIDYINTGEFFGEDHESGADRIVLMIQELERKIRRAALLSESEQVIADLVIPDPVASFLLGWNSAGTQLQNIDSATLTGITDLTPVTSPVVNGQVGAADLVGWTLDAASFSSGFYFVEIFRPATVDLMSNGIVFLQRVNGVWRRDLLIFSTLDVASGQPAGVTLTVTESGGIAQMQYESTNETGGINGTVIHRALRF